MNFEEAGAALRAEREKRNFSIEDVARQLKIGPRQIRALESGDMNSLPHPAYAKGFIRSYAGWLGLNLDDLPPTANNQSHEEDQEAPIVMDAGQEKKKGGSGGIWFFLLVLLCAAAIWYAWQQNFWGLLSESHEEQSSLTKQLPRADAYLAKKEELEKQSDKQAENRIQAPPLEEKPVAAPVELPEAVLPPPVQSVQSDARVEEQKPAVPAEAASAMEKAASANDETAGETLPPANHKLIITAIEECWVHSNSDKTDTRQFSLRKGDTFALTFAESLELKLGNAGGVRLRYDGKDMPAPGTSGQVKTIIFPPAKQE